MFTPQPERTKSLEGKKITIYCSKNRLITETISYRYDYWLLYRLPELPDPSNPPGNQLIAPVGVDEMMVEDGEHYLYWYKKL